MEKAKEKSPAKAKKLSPKKAKKMQAQRMKKQRKGQRRGSLSISFTLCFMILSLLIIAIHYFGMDGRGIILIGLNPMLKSISFTEFGLNVISKGPAIAANTAAGGFSVYWYIAHLLTFVLYGAVLDVIQALIKRLIRFVKQPKEKEAKANKA